MPDVKYLYVDPAKRASRQGQVMQETHSSLVTGNLAQDYLDELLLRLMPGNDDWYRSHFPVIMETNKSHYFNDRIYE